ncbi:MAG: hypothetical protein H6978_11795 [Gammaproteobacteria bacterium]|nr:hypothetical protein [Gammaproteobacteria bacterium]
MSLLMDALRKAEQEKRRQQAEQPAQEPVATVGAAEPAAAAATEPPRELALELEPLVPPARPDISLVLDPGETTLERELNQTSEDLNQTKIEPPASAGRSGFERVHRSLNDLSISGETTPAGPLDGFRLNRTAATDLTSPTLPLGTVVTAQTVFDAGGGSARLRALKWTAIGIALLVVSLAGAALYYYQLTPVARDIPLQTTRPAPAPLPGPQLAANATPTPAVASTAAETSAAQLPQPAQAPDVSAEPPPTSPVPPEPARAAAPTSTPRSRPLGDDVLPGQLRITRRAVDSSVDPDLVAGYAAFTRGDLSTATAHYRAALDRLHESRDAWLGLGAIAIREGQRDAALANYAEVLHRWPDDTVAASAMLALSRGADTAANESQLKLMLATQPDAAHLHFALGNVYAASGRWADAQQAYFDAYRLDDTNADYAFNLAIGLDRLGSYKVALDFYLRAASLAAQSPARFDRAQLDTRVAALQAMGNAP